jgi:hypothetical protein
VSKRAHAPPHKYTPAEIRFLERNIAGRSYAELAELFNRRLGLPVTAEQMRRTASRYGLSNGRGGRFKPGQTPFNKGKKGYYSPGSEKGWFRPGHKPWTYKPVGTERINGDGYVDVRIRNPTGKCWKNWKAKHRIIWEKARGKIPRGHVVIFADGDKRNFAPDNLLMISQKELGVMNLQGLISPNAGLTRIGKTIADIRILIAGRKRGIKKNEKSRAGR